jgi:VIT1/CCC1 family predicted Fe2+/Mn2+ transporter
MKQSGYIRSHQREKKREMHVSCSQIIPFAFLPLETARLVSLIITATLLLLLGVGRGLIGHRNVVLTARETLGIAAAAVLAGFLIGKLVTR